MSVLRGTLRASQSDTGNDLLDHLSATVRSRVLRGSELVRMERGHQVFAPGEPIKDVLFPITAVCSLMLGLRSGQHAGTGTIGNEGMVGAPAILDTRPTERAVVQIAGNLLVLHGESLRGQMERHTSVRRIFRRYVAYSYDMAKQDLVCGAFHTIDQRVPRWLLIACDRARADHLPFTQDLLSQMVAASRPRVSEAITRLRADGLVDYGRGFLRVLDRRGLEKRACECYAAMKDWASRFAWPDR